MIFKMTKSRKLAYLALLATSVIWGLSPPVIKYSLNYISPATFLFYRFLFTSLILLVPFVIKLLKVKPKLNDLPIYLLLGFLCTPLNLYLWFVGLQKTTAVDATLISIVSPILVIAGGVLFLQERITKIERIGIILTFAGTIMTLIQPIVESGGKIGQNVFGNILVFLGAVAWAIFTILAKKYSKRIDSFLLSSSSFFLGLILIIPLVFLEGNLKPAAHIAYFSQNFSSFLGIVFMVIFGSVIAYYAYIYGVSKIEASEATIFTYLQPVFAIPVSILFLKESVSLPFWIGAILIIVGVFVCEQRSPIFRRNR